MSAYDTTYRHDGVWVRWYCEAPDHLDDEFAVYFEVGDTVKYISAERASDIAEGLLKAAKNYLERRK